MRRRYHLLWLILLTATLAGCQPATAVEENPTATAPDSDILPAATDPLPTDMPESTEDEAADLQNSPLTLTLWLPPEVDPSPEAVFGQALDEMIAAFNAQYPDIRVDVYRKRVSGPGGMISYLRTAGAVAPDVLPDLLLMDREGALTALNEDLIVPISEISADLSGIGLYPTAAAIGQSGDVSFSLPYLLEVQHLVYRQGVFIRPPCTYAVQLDARVPLEFAAAPLGGLNQTTLLQYLAAGATLTDGEGNPTLDAAILTEVLSFYDYAQDLAIIQSSVFQYSTPTELWSRYLERQNNQAIVSSTLVLTAMPALENTAYCPVPTVSGSPFSIVHGYSWLVATDDERQQDAAMSFLTFITDPIVQGNFTRAAGWLPSQPEALAVWGEDAYTTFVASLLETSVARPVSEPELKVGRIIQLALEDVLLNNLSPVQAATDASQAFDSDGE